MNIVLVILSVIVGLIALVLIIALFTKKEYIIEEQVEIARPRQTVFDYLKITKNQDQFSKWNKMDPNARKTYSGTDGTVGFIYAWDSDNKNAGKGEQEIKSIKEGERIQYELRFEKPFKNVCPGWFTTESTATQSTRVRWGMESKMKYPMNAILLFINLPKMLATDMQTSLADLKTILENK